MSRAHGYAALAVLFCFVVADSTGVARADEPAGVVARCGTIAGRVFRDVSAAVKRLFAKRVADHPHVAVVEDDGSLLEPGDMNLCGVSRIFYKSHADDRHFIFVFAQGGSKYAEGYNAYYMSLRNDVMGIGRRIEDRTGPCGSRGVMLGFANMNGTDKWKSFLYPLLDLWPLGVITHELGHQWIAFINTPVKGMRLTTDPSSALRSHWQPLLQTDASIMYGNHWRKLPFNNFISMKLPNTFSPLDKYLMGIYPASRVPEFYAIKASSSKVWKHYALPGNTAHGKAVKLSVQDIQAVVGPRVPDWRSAQRRFKAAFVLVVPKGQKATPQALRVVEYFRRRIPEKIRQETDGAFAIETELRPAAP